MAWKEINVVDQRKLLVELYFKENNNISDLCRQFDISRPTAYKWIEAYEKEGEEGLVNKSRAPINQCNRTEPVLRDMILATKFQYPKLGAKKLLPYLRVTYPNIHWPCKTTIENILKENGLVIPRKTRLRFATKTDPLAHATACNKVWSMDFKGWWLTNDGFRFEPLTIFDNHSRYVIRCLRIDRNDGDHVWAILERAFAEYGLPYYMRNDNGPPFATSTPGRLSRLSVRVIKAGVIPEWIEPGNPQENGRHERMHGTLQREGVFHELNSAEQEMELIEFQNYYNFIRPHETLGQVTPGSVYYPSERIWTGRLRDPDYTDDFQVTKVASCGKISWRGTSIYVSRVLENELVGIEKYREEPKVFFGPIYLGTLTRKNELEVPRREGRIRKNIPLKYTLERT